MRVSYEELNELCSKLETDRLWSWSRVNCVHNSLYEYFLKYVLKRKEDRDNSIYKVTGGISHDIIEKFYSGEIEYDQMIEEFNDGWMTAFDIAELKFNRSDSEKNDSIAEKYYYDLENFFKTHNKIPYKVQLEQFVTVKIGEEYYQGYIDCCFKDKDGNYVILDWKTSSIYKGEKAKNESGQLCMYAMALHQKGIPYEKIKIAWNFLKYVNVFIEQPKKFNVSWVTVKGEEKVKEKLEESKIVSTLKASLKAWLKECGYDKAQIEEYVTKMEESNSITAIPQDVLEKAKLTVIECEIVNEPRQIERCKLGESLYANVKSKMKSLGYSEDEIFEILENFVETNDMNCLPEEVRSLYTLEDCYVYVDLTEELVKDWEDYIISTTKMIRSKEAEYEQTNDETIWFESPEEVEKQSFYFANLCGYSANLHKPYKLWLESREAEKNGDVFGNVKKNEDLDEDDLSWLNDL